MHPVAYDTISFLTKSFIEHSSYSISQSFPSYRYLLPLSSSRLASAPSSSSLFLSLLHPPLNICSDRMLLSISECIITVYGVLMRFALGGRGRNYPSSRKWNKCLPPDGGLPPPPPPRRRLPINMLLSVIHYITHFIAFATLECRRWVVRGISILVTPSLGNLLLLFNSCFICERYFDGRSRLSCTMVLRLKY